MDRITERANKSSESIDLVSPVEMIDILRRCDQQMFDGFENYPGLSSTDTQQVLADSIDRLSRFLATSNNAPVVISGAGTSGRIAVFCCRHLNRILKSKGRKSRFIPLISGGRTAFVRSIEGAEDNPRQAVADLQAALSNAGKFFLIGISCGLSAPSIAAQIEYGLRKKEAECLLIGFNPDDQARDVQIEPGGKTFREVVRTLRGNDRGLMINPVVGPETIAGSTRLKGGSATKMLLETIGISAILKAAGNDEALFPGTDSSEAARWWVEQYKEVYRNAYFQKEPIGRLIALGGQALKSGSHIYYFGHGSLGLLGVIDASECPPTFGADFDDVRGFVPGGRKTLEWNCSMESGSLPMPSFDQDEFEKGILPSLQPNDLVVGLAFAEKATGLFPVLVAARERGANCAVIRVGRCPRGLVKQIRPDCSVELDIQRTGLKEPDQCFAELAVKMVLNALSTGAHVLAGKVYSNRMIDLRITNSKLYDRAIRMVSELGSVDAIRAEQALKAVILHTKRAVSENMSISETIRIASTKKRVIPEAVLVARSSCSPQEAAEMIQGDPLLRHFLENTPDG